MKVKILLMFLITSTLLTTIILSTPFSKVYGYENDIGKKQYPTDTNLYPGNDNYKKDKPIVFLPDEKIAALGDKWWKWAYSINTETDTNPFSEFNQEGCNAGLQNYGDFLFLIGSSDLPQINCELTQNTKILFPILNVLCNSLDSTPFFGSNEEEQRECSEEIMDEAFDLELKINGYPVKDPEKYRLGSPEGSLEFTAAENNPFFTPPGDGTGVSDGFWVLLKLPKGEHKISFKGSVDLSNILGEDFVFTAGAAYNLNVINENKHKIDY